jgi:hypothetical protein
MLLLSRFQMRALPVGKASMIFCFEWSKMTGND